MEENKTTDPAPVTDERTTDDARTARYDDPTTGYGRGVYADEGAPKPFLVDDPSCVVDDPNCVITE